MSGTANRAAALCMAALLAACSTDTSPNASSEPSATAETSSRPTASGSPSTTASTAPVDPQLREGWGPDRSELARASQMVSDMRLPRLAGQVIVAAYDGTDAPSAMVNDLHLGGVIALEGNIRTGRQVRRSNQALQRSAETAGRRWPVFIGVDQEGGVVERLEDTATRFPTFMTAGAAGSPGLTSSAAAASGAELTSLGFTVVFAPVADVTSGAGDPTIGSRAASSRPGSVATQVHAAVEGYLSSGIVPVVKHFPGHGSVPADSHLELPVQDKPLPALMRSDLVPFRAAVAGVVPSIMVAHIDVRSVAPGVPSTLSRKIVSGLLRERLGFRGLVVTDAMNMAGVTEQTGPAESVVRALRAGNDVVLMPPDPRVARTAIIAAVRDGRLSRSRLEQAASRQVAILLHQQGREPSLRRRPGSSQRISQRLSAAGVSVVAGPCRGRLVGSSVQATGPEEAVARFDRAARRAGLDTGGGSTVVLIGYGGTAARADIVVSLDTPYVLGASRAGTAKIALYGDTSAAMRALVKVLLGEKRAPGRLPVEVDGVERAGC